MIGTLLPAFEDTGRRFNGHVILARRIGTYHHTDADRVFEEPQEVAAWHRVGKFPVGEYPIVEYIGSHGHRYVHVELDGGSITSCSMPSLFGGMAYGKDQGPKEIGDPFKHSFEITTWAIAKAILNRSSLFVFDPAIVTKKLGEYDSGEDMVEAYDPGTCMRVGY